MKKLSIIVAFRITAGLTAAGTFITSSWPADAADPAIAVFSGVQGEQYATYGYLGGVMALNNNLNTDGLRIRVSGGIGQYSYDIVPGIREGVGFQQADAMIGYQLVLGAAQLSAYGGIELQNHDDANPAAITHGTSLGAKGQIELYSPLGEQFYGFALSSLSSNYTSFYTKAKVDYRIDDRWSIGPEGNVDGSITYTHASAGGFVSYSVGGPEISLSSGYVWDLRSAAPGAPSADSVYGALGLTFRF